MLASLERPVRTFVVCHGAWSAGWAWRKMRPLLHNLPHSALFTPTLTGLGERAHLAAPTINLETHITDVLAMLAMEDLLDVTLIGHSYGGMVATGVADRARDRIARLIYLDAFVPENGKSLYELIGRPIVPNQNWRVEPRPIPPDTSECDTRWMAERRTPQPLATFTAPLHLSSEAGFPPRSYIRCTRVAPDDPLLSSYERVRRSGWPLLEIDASHNPHITTPNLLAAALDELCGRT
jgi:pimeloyl-ACP methyl ester carboxylesterase